MPDSVKGIYAYQIVSGFDVYKPDKHEELFARYGSQGMDFHRTLIALGFEREAKQDNFYHYEENWRHETFNVKTAVADPGAGNSVDVTLPASNLGTGNSFYPRLWDLVVFPNEVTGVITTVNVGTPTAPVLTIAPQVTTDNIGALSAGDELVIYSNAFSEYSGQPDGRVTGVYQYENDCQIIKETLKVSGSELTRDSWIKVYQGKRLVGYYNKARQVDIDHRVSLAISGACLVGKRTTATITDSATGNTIKTTEGLIPVTRSRGYEYPKTHGTFAVADFNAIDLYLAQNYAGNNILVGCGIERHQELEDVLVEYFKDTNIQFARQRSNEVLFNGNESLGAAVNFKYLVKSERTFNFKRLMDLHNPKTFGATGYDYSKIAIFLSLGKKRDARTGEMIPSIGMRYRKLGNYSRKMEIWENGTAGLRLKIGDVDGNSTYIRSHCGFEAFGANQFALVHE